nr:L814 [uncultured bacterium]
MIRPEYRKILLDQRGAAVILWSCFVISIPIYLVIARQVLENPNLGSNRSFAEPARIVLWLLTLVDFGYYVFWRKRHLTSDSILRNARTTKLFRALQEFRGATEERVSYVVSAYITRKVVVFAIIEAIAVYGLVLAVIGRFVQDQYWLSALSVALLAFEFPSEKAVEALVRAAEQAPPKNGG